MTKGAKEEWEKFTCWCEERNLQAEYNSREDLERLKQILRNQVDNKIKNKNC
jgi:hypothetical protein